jgi:hypothetical protein
MNTTTPDNATSWRDLQDGLTFDQVGWMLNFRARRSVIPRRWLRFCWKLRAAMFGRTRMDAERFGHLPAPAGAVKVEHWEEDDGTGRWVRQFSGASSVVERPVPQFPNFPYSVEVAIEGVQHEDGRVERYAHIFSEGTQFTAEDARQLAGALIDAAAELDRLAGGDAGKSAKSSGLSR